MIQAEIAAVPGKPSDIVSAAIKSRSAWITIVLPAMVFWALFVWINGPSGWGKMVNTGLVDNDDLMRFAQIQDFLLGQAFFDLHQSRMNAPNGLDMHWSRLIDMPVAGLFFLGKKIFGGQLAGPFSVTVWPMLTLLPALIALGFICRETGGRDAILPGLFFSFMATTPLYFFTPGKIDHHNIQMAFCVAMVAFALISQRYSAAALASGVTMAVMLSIGLEGLPYALICAMWFPVLWIMHGDRFADQLVRFSVGLGAGSVLLFFGLTMPSAGFSTDCDVITFTYLPAIMLGTFGLVVLGSRGHLFSTWKTRFGAAIFVGGLAVLTIAFIEPACLAGPYSALTPELKKQWFNNVQETQSIFGVIGYHKIKAFVKYPYLILAFGLGLFTTLAAIREQRSERFGLVLLMVMLGAGIGITLLQVRAATFATFLAIPMYAAFGASLQSRLSGRVTPVRMFLIVGSVWVVGANMTWHAFGAYLQGGNTAITTTESSKKGCGLPLQLGVLKGLKPGVVLNSIYLGPWIVSHTKHGAVAGPYHRNVTGILDARYALTGHPETAHEIIKKRNAKYVAWCETNGEGQNMQRANPAGLVAQVAAGNTPSWLVPLTDHKKTALRVFRVKP